MVTGVFHGRNGAETLDIILHGDVHYHEWMSAEVVSIIKAIAQYGYSPHFAHSLACQMDERGDFTRYSNVIQFLTKTPNRRLGCAEGEENAIRAHPSFNQIDREAMESRNVKPPFKPTIMCKFDLSNFLWQYTRQAGNLTATDPEDIQTIDMSNLLILTIQISISIPDQFHFSRIVFHCPSIHFFFLTKCPSHNH